MEEKESKINDIDERSEQVREVLTRIPSWIFRWGINIVFFILVIIILLAYFIKYPDTLEAKAVVTTLTPSVNIVAKSTGKITSLLVKNNTNVLPNQILAVIENTANYTDVLKIKAAIDSLSLRVKVADTLPKFNLSDTLRMGELTTNYLLFLKSYKEMNLFTEINPQKSEIHLLNKQLLDYNDLLTKYAKQENLYKEELALVEKDYTRDMGLYQNKVIAARDFENKKKEYIVAQRNLQNQTIITTNTKITVSNIEKNKLQLQIQYYEELNKLKTELDQSNKNLKSAIDTWMQKNLLIAPIEGKISFFNFWATNQYIKEGEEIFTIAPTKKQQIIAKLLLPMQNSGKVKLGQKVLIKLDNYAYTEFGMLTGKVINISLVANNNNYMIDVDLPNGLKSTYNKQIPFKDNISGTAEIITDNLSVLDRVFFTLIRKQR
jgi:multidrug resistance efflux pump